MAKICSNILLIICGCSSTESPRDTPIPVPPLLGADVSALERIEQAGGVFRSGRQPGDALAILRARGSNLFRLRLFVNPNGQEVQVNDLAYTIRMATRVKAAGATLLLDLHCSDTWADPGHQDTPAAWVSLDIDALEQQVETYTADVITQLKQAGALPDIVQVGNEIDGGMLWPLGQLSYGSDSLASWDRFTRLLKAGISGLQSALGPGDTVRVMLHYSQGGNSGGTQWFFDHLDARGVSYDLIGLSYYPWWHGTLLSLKANLNATALRFNRDVICGGDVLPLAGRWLGIHSDEPGSDDLGGLSNGTGGVPAGCARRGGNGAQRARCRGSLVVSGVDRGSRALYLGRRIACPV
ncbi:MAG: glycosyl hydrolase 53 family protein [Gemmatimonadota bacterium]